VDKVSIFSIFLLTIFFFLLVIGSGAGEPGLGRAATAGIVCGIIFTAVIVTAEIIFFKFFYAGGVGRASAYLA
jgi:hypothetical protein